MKIVVNRCFGGFGLPDKAKKMLGHNQDWYEGDIDRTNKDLVRVVEELGKEANDSYARLEIVEIPDDIDYYISDYDGIETIHES